MALSQYLKLNPMFWDLIIAFSVTCRKRGHAQDHLKSHVMCQVSTTESKSPLPNTTTVAICGLKY